MRPMLLLVALTALASGCAMQPAATTAAAPADERVEVASQEGAIALEWQLPRERLDGTPLSSSDIAGYRIYIGNRPGHTGRVIAIDDPQQTRVLLRGLKPGHRYHVAISTVDREGLESPRSTESRLVAAPITEEQVAAFERERSPIQHASLE